MKKNLLLVLLCTAYITSSSALPFATYRTLPSGGLPHSHTELPPSHKGITARKVRYQKLVILLHYEDTSQKTRIYQRYDHSFCVIDSRKRKPRFAVDATTKKLHWVESIGNLKMIETIDPEAWLQIPQPLSPKKGKNSRRIGARDEDHL